VSRKTQKRQQKRRRSFIGWLFNQLMLLGLFYLFVRWWQRSQEEEAQQQRKLGGQEESIPLARYDPGEAPQQPQTQPVDAPQAARFWPSPEIVTSQAEAAPVETAMTEPAVEEMPWEAAPGEGITESGETSGPAAPDDLSVLEGIGPKISSLLQEAGITTFRQLAETDPGRLEEILREAGLNLADPGTWPEQARLLADGDKQGFKTLIEQLKAGRRD
jgi:predicted flap endonuclease-1-like 5' DNA nuclease